MNQNASPSSPAQNDVIQNHTTSNNNTQTFTDINTTADINTSSLFREPQLLTLASLMAPSDEARPPPKRQRSLSGDSAYYSAQDSEMAAEVDMFWDRPFEVDCSAEPDTFSLLDQPDAYRGSLPNNVTTSNCSPPQPPQIVIEKNHQGGVAREVRVIISGGIWDFILSLHFFFFFLH